VPTIGHYRLSLDVIITHAVYSNCFFLFFFLLTTPIHTLHPSLTKLFFFVRRTVLLKETGKYGVNHNLPFCLRFFIRARDMGFDTLWYYLFIFVLCDDHILFVLIYHQHHFNNISLSLFIGPQSSRFCPHDLVAMSVAVCLDPVE